MVRLPDEFIATRVNGYFFNTENEILYSVKIGGVLRPLPIVKPNRFNWLKEPAFYVSVNGNRKAYVLSQLRALAKKAKENPQDELIPVL